MQALLDSSFSSKSGFTTSSDLGYDLDSLAYCTPHFTYINSAEKNKKKEKKAMWI